MDFIFWLENIYGMKRSTFYQLWSRDQNEIYEEYEADMERL